MTGREPGGGVDGIPAPVRWDAEAFGGPVVVLLDQTRLPREEAEAVCANVPDLVDAVQRLVVRGAPLLGIVGGYGVALAAARGYDVEGAALELARARPTAVNLAWGVERVLGVYRAAAAHGSTGAAAGAALAEARLLHAEDAAASAAMASHGLGLLEGLLPAGGWRLLTHCNTGVLVSGGAGTALGVVRQAHEAGRLRRLWVDETRPLLQGARLTAWEAARSGMPYSVLVDGAAGALFAAGEVDAVLVGADRIAADGSTANKVGTYGLSVLARHHGVPFVVVAPVSTVDFGTADGAGIEVEQRQPSEVTEFGGVRVAPAGAGAFNPAFDVTPPGLIAAIVTEMGVLSPVSHETIDGLRIRSRTGNETMKP
ncbi:S-methyl-5-thioribose-1-phosphate isomerase [Mangrovactinospora gilvigrisea]|uniref:Methylthioribose-1-phosphate isomerase n=1 Tax=Mangrovactinospora gilvigrisea TaxID=1428644 RepID=A0A1J7C7S8_9ACTN|nr:S-methyl-5-thioribose-1-phosphate isomerase [Mangrovactinospora gilvigrisea]OIV37592.1 S-methyl-5-thioribose-1-phosphate isomerase [Mangrovactinospora gilvigrisea]